jgi:hypothetical protein
VLLFSLGLVPWEKFSPLIIFVSVVLSSLIGVVFAKGVGRVWILCFCIVPWLGSSGLWCLGCSG